MKTKYKVVYHAEWVQIADNPIDMQHVKDVLYLNAKYGGLPVRPIVNILPIDNEQVEVGSWNFYD